MTAPPRGRPRRTSALADSRITIRLTADERAELDAAAAPLSTSDYVRDVALEAARSAAREATRRGECPTCSGRIARDGTCDHVRALLESGRAAVRR